MFVSFFSIFILIVSFIEIIRKLDSKEVSFITKLLFSFKQVPFFLEQILPFLFLLTSVTIIVFLTKRSELIISKAAGVSLWKIGCIFSSMSILCAFLFILLVNPISVKWVKEYDKWSAQQAMQKISFEQKIYTDKNNVIMTASRFSPEEGMFYDIIFYEMNDQETVQLFIEAPQAHYNFNNKNLIFYNGKVTSFDKSYDQTTFKDYHYALPALASFLVLPSRHANLYSLYEYPEIIRRYQVYQEERPALLVAFLKLCFLPISCGLMTILGVLFSPSSFRSKKILVSILSTIIAGFVFYVLDMIFILKAENSILPIWVSIIFMKVVLLLVSHWVLLWREYR